MTSQTASESALGGIAQGDAPVLESLISMNLDSMENSGLDARTYFLARLDGRLIRLQGFNLDSPRKVPQAEIFYPPKLSPDGAPAGPAAAAQAVPTPTVWAPRLVPPPDAPGVEEADPDELVPAAGVPRIGAADPKTSSATEDQGDPFARRRRRTV